MHIVLPETFVIIIKAYLEGDKEAMALRWLKHLSPENIILYVTVVIYSRICVIHMS